MINRIGFVNGESQDEPGPPAIPPDEPAELQVAAKALSDLSDVWDRMKDRDEPDGFRTRQTYVAAAEVAESLTKELKRLAGPE